jgi:hypothetical protein
MSPDRPEHIATHDPCTDIVEATRGEVVINARRAPLFAGHLPKRAGGDDPFVQRFAADAEGIVAILLRAGAVAVEGYGEGVDAELRHVRVLPFWFNRSRRLRRQDRASTRAELSRRD